MNPPSVSRPEPATLFCGRTHVHLDSVDSTNSELSRRLRTESSLPEGFLLTTSYQTSGRGYAGNVWQSEPDESVLMSLLLTPSFLLPRRQFYLTQALSLAVHDTFAKELKHAGFKIKWPNDLVCNGKKISGMLIESHVHGETIQYTIAGIGINLKQREFPENLNATSLFLETNKNLDVNKATERLCQNIEARYLQLRNGHVEALQRDYMKRLYQVEEFADYRIFGTEMQGKIVGLNAEGKLVLDTESGFQVCGFKEVEYL